VRRGDDTIDNFSELPDLGEDLIVEYLDNSGGGGVWRLLTSYLGGGTAGEVFNDSIQLPNDGLHGNFQLRFRQTGGNGNAFDFWHIDDVQIIETLATLTPPDLDIGICDDFEQALGSNWTFSTFGGVSSATSNSTSSSMYVNGGGTVTSRVIDTSTGFDGFTVWVREGADVFSENPEGTDDLAVEYFNNASNWVTLETLPGGGAQGDIFNRPTQYLGLPAAAQHANFQIRFRMTAGSGALFDYWHIDDVCFVGGVNADLQIVKSTRVESDPVNVTNPKAIVGATMIYQLDVSNTTAGVTVNNTTSVTDVLPADVSLFVGNFDGSGSPIDFTDGAGALSSGLSYTFVSVNNAFDSVEFLNAGGTPITVVPDVDGYDSNVRQIRVNMGGQFNGSSISGDPEFRLEYRVRID